MSLSSQQLDAFVEIAKRGSFTEAAKSLHLTQAALSLRIKNLETELGATLLIRDPSNLRLTELGQELLKYANAKQALEREFMANVGTGNTTALSGAVKVAGLSTIVRRLVIPSLAPLLRQHPGIQTELKIGETQDLVGLLRSGSADFIFFSSAVNRMGIENHHVGDEVNVLVESKTEKTPDDLYIDSDERDTTTIAFMKAQGVKNPKFRRQFFDEIFSILDGVEAGIGRAVAPLHLVRDNPNLRIVKGMKPLRIPIHLVWQSQPFYTKLQEQVRAALIEGVGKQLKAAE